MKYSSKEGVVLEGRISINLCVVKSTKEQANLKLDHVLGMLIPLPPLAEQHRIVSQIAEIMPFIDNLTQ